MRRFRFLSLTAAVAAYALVPAASGQTGVHDLRTGNDLYDFCKTDAAWAGLICMVLIQGVTEGVSGAFVYRHLKPPFCIPSSVTKGQLEAVVVHWMEVHPDKRHLPATAIVEVAIEQAFPCTTK